ncbi:hypothetical protein GCM10009430_22520 [Aquimarina litoralis]|uniref:Hsp20/alpha crystallin family protein n=1 Tax=Aquimarina litoralis TaxID=584605 RepID=A0ABP3U491_9FLAO
MKIINSDTNDFEKTTTQFKFQKIVVDIKDELISYKIASPLLKQNNYRIKAQNGILNISVMIDDVVSKPDGKNAIKKKLFEVFLVIPKSNFNQVTSINFLNNTLLFTIKKDIDFNINYDYTKRKQEILNT